jgi:hypothetical protein
VTPVTCERLEQRQLLTIYEYTVPATWNAAYLVSTIPGEVQVRRDSATGEIGTTFDVGQGMYLVKATTNNFLFVDTVPAANKPTTDSFGHNGTKVELINNATGGHLKIEATELDELIRITESTSTGGTVEARFNLSSSQLGNSRFGAGVNQLTIQTHPDGGAEVRVASQEPNGVPPLPGLAAQTSLRIESLGTDDTIHLGGADFASVAAVVRTGAGNNKVFLLHGLGASHTTAATVDFDPNLGGGLGSGHRLQIGIKSSGLNCTATLAQVSGTQPHTINVDMVYVHNGNRAAATGEVPGKVIFQDQTTIGEMRLHLDSTGAGVPVASVDAPLTASNSAGQSGRVRSDGRIDFAAASAPSTVYQFDTGVFDEFDDIPTPLSLSTGVINVNSGASVTALTSSKNATLNIPTMGKFTLQARPSASDPRSC